MIPISNEREALLGNRASDVTTSVDFDETDDSDDNDYPHHEFVALKNRAWSFSQSRRQVATAATSSPRPSASHQLSAEARRAEEAAQAAKEESRVSNSGQHYLFCSIYAVVNVIIAAPALFGYAAVIFNHPIFANHMNALSKRKEIFVLQSFTIFCVI